MKYDVQLGYSSIVRLIIEAESEDDAIIKARKERALLYDSDFQRWQEEIMENIEPWCDSDTADEQWPEEMQEEEEELQPHRRNSDFCAKCGGECYFDQEGNRILKNQGDER